MAQRSLDWDKLKPSTPRPLKETTQSPSWTLAFLIRSYSTRCHQVESPQETAGLRLTQEMAPRTSDSVTHTPWPPTDGERKRDLNFFLFTSGIKKERSAWVLILPHLLFDGSRVKEISDWKFRAWCLFYNFHLSNKCLFFKKSKKLKRNNNVYKCQLSIYFLVSELKPTCLLHNCL